MLLNCYCEIRIGKTGLHLWRDSVRFVFLSIIAVLLSGCTQRCDDDFDVTLTSLLHNLTNVNAIADSPIGNAKMISSYDRTGGNQDWGDYTVSSAQDGLVDIANIQGPGVVHRIWMTGQNPAAWKFFIDGDEESVIENIDAYADQGLGLHHAFVSLQNMKSGGYTSYMPIPFAKSLRIAVSRDDKRNRRYYQINYELYPHGTKVRSLRSTLSQEERNVVDDVRESWKGLDCILKRAADACKETSEINLKGGSVFKWIDLSGPGTLSTFWVNINRDSVASIGEQDQLLRELVLKIYWDGEVGPSVNVPLGDFFCNAFHYRKFSSLALGKVGDRYICRFPMPFAGAVKAEIVNEGTNTVSIELGYEIQSTRAKNANYFHSTWNQTRAFRNPPNKPHRVLFANGKGHLVGCYLNAIGAEPNWFILEGDDVISRDGEIVPSLHGTGLEDYFNGAWYYQGLSDLAFSGLLEKAAMRTAQYRYHFPDKIAFDKQLLFSFEFGHVLGSASAANTSRGYMSSVAYWYQNVPAPAAELSRVEDRMIPIDSLKPATIMSELLELERVGCLDEARDRAKWYSELFKDSQIGAIMKLRTLGYDLVLGEIKLPVAELKKYVLEKGEEVAYDMAQQWLSIYENGENHLLHVNTSCNYECYVDGVLRMSGDDPRFLYTKMIRLKPGEHELVVKVVNPGRVNNPWLSASLQSQYTNINFTTSWDMTGSELQGDEKLPTTSPDVVWTHEETRSFYHTRQDCWALAVNPYVCVQSQPMLRVNKGAFKKRAGAVIYYRKIFETDQR